MPNTGKFFIMRSLKFQYLSYSGRTSFLPVIWSGEDSNAFAIVCNFITFVFHLMTTYYVVKSVLLQKALGNIWTILDSDTPLARRAATLRLWIWPQQLAHDACNEINSYHTTTLVRVACVVDYCHVIGSWPESGGCLSLSTFLMSFNVTLSSLNKPPCITWRTWNTVTWFLLMEYLMFAILYCIM